MPAALVDQALTIAHEGHPGLVRTKQTIRDKLWFPGINEKVKTLVESCISCQATVPHFQHQPVQMSSLPDHPWHSIAADHFGPSPTGEYLLVVSDEYSRFPIVATIPSTSSSPTIRTLRNLFSMFGIPSKLKTDNGPPFTSNEFKQFANEYGFDHCKITPRWPQANGLIERQMPMLAKTIRTALLDRTHWQDVLPNFLMNFRATAHPTTGQAPASLFFNRPIQTKLPTIIPVSPQDKAVRETDTKHKSQMKTYSDASRHSSPHTLRIGDFVLPKLLQRNKFDPLYDVNPWKITAIHGSNISIQNVEGKSLNRNCSLLKRFNSNQEHNDNKTYPEIYTNPYDKPRKPSQQRTQPLQTLITPRSHKPPGNPQNTQNRQPMNLRPRASIKHPQRFKP